MMTTTKFGLLLTNISGAQPGTDLQLVATLVHWQAFRIPSGAIHLVGYCVERNEGRASTALVSFDPRSRRCTTESGRVYVLSGPPGSDGDARCVWSRFKSVYDIVDDVEVTMEMASALERDT